MISACEGGAAEVALAQRPGGRTTARLDGCRRAESAVKGASAYTRSSFAILVSSAAQAGVLRSS